MELGDIENGQTPLEEEEKEGLKLKFINTKDELNEFEQKNIEDAMLWISKKSFKAEFIISKHFICMLHKKMFGKVWKWAGVYRKTDKNLGVHHSDIPVAVKILCDDTLYWIKNEIFQPDEIALRFKHRLVTIHCFPNGNGRHSRLIADIIIEKIFKRELFSWGMRLNKKSNEIRDEYIKAIRSADQNNYQHLKKFARS